MENITWIYILAGGQSSRFGQNKAIVSIQGQPLIVRLANQVAKQGFKLRIVAQKASDYDSIAFPIVEDAQPNAGPLAGVLAALHDSDRNGWEWCLISNCDLLDWHAAWFPLFIAHSARHPDHDIIVLQTAEKSRHAGADGCGSEEKEKQRLEFRPFPGLYRTRLLPELEQLWNAGVRSMRDVHLHLASRVGACPIASDTLPKSFNTVAELEGLLGMADK